RQETRDLSFQPDYNRILGLKTNYLSTNRKWSGLAGYSQSFSDQVKGQQHAFSIENNYNTRSWSFSSRLSQVGKNYFTDIGFVPRLENYDALTEQVFRAGYTQIFQSLSYNYYPENQTQVQSFRPINAELNLYLDEAGRLYETNAFYNVAVFFANQMSLYLNSYHDAIQLNYAFDPLRNGQFILPDRYQNTAFRLGYNSDYTRQVYGSVNVQYGSFFEGQRSRFGAVAGFRLLPLFNLELNYEYNALDIGALGQADLHLLGLTTELFFSNKLNWTTYLQYNKQIDNFNINSRLQWEYKPLSFVYLVFSDNYNQLLDRKNWAVSLKVNRRLNF
ncbi:MAG: hypothetical protein KDC44_14220, partial [Phaeodactylibacter sp.]|nr:hypothetical protein [Phaeodactylibacter sp.]